MKIFSHRSIFIRIILLSFLLLFSFTGCGSEKNQAEKNTAASFPERYIAEDYPLSDDVLAVSAVASLNNSIYLSVIKDVSGNQTYDANTSQLVEKLCFIDFSAEAINLATIPYAANETNRIVQISPNDDGTLDLVTQNYGEVKESGEPVITDTWIKKISVNGEELLSYSIMEDVKNQDMIYPTDFMTDQTGNGYVMIQDTLYVWDSAGKLRCSIQVPNSLSHMSPSRDGDACLIWLGTDGCFQMATVDIEAGSLKLGNTLSPEQTYLDMAAGIQSDLLLASSDGVYVYDKSQGEEKKIISFSQLNMSVGFSGTLLPLSDDKMAWFQTENNENTLTVIRGGEETELSQENTLILGGTFSSVLPWHHQAVAAFNKTSPDIRIEIQIYGSEKTDGIDELNMDIANRQGPDILILPRRFSMDLYARKGVLTDLYPYMDSDEEMERSDFQGNILQAYETDEMLYGMPITYFINTMIVPTSAVGDMKQWNMDEMIAFADRYMPGSTVFSEANKSHVLNLCMMANGDSLVDWSEKGQGFNRELFLKMLLFADRFLPDETYIYDEDMIFQQIQDTGQIQILCHETVTDFLRQQMYMEAFGEPISFLGYPSEHGNGNLIDSNFVMAINSTCKDKDAAWQFIGDLLSEESQWLFANVFAFPIRKSVLEQKVESEMRKSYVTDENGIKIEEKRETRPFGMGKMDIYAAREEEVQTVLAVLNSADKIRSWDEQMNQIINDEVGAFFTGNKTADEVVDIIESRIQIYVNETK